MNEKRKEVLVITKQIKMESSWQDTYNTSVGHTIHEVFYGNTLVMYMRDSKDKSPYAIEVRRGIFDAVEKTKLVDGKTWIVMYMYNMNNLKNRKENSKQLDDIKEKYCLHTYMTKNSEVINVDCKFTSESKKECAYDQCNMPFSRMKCAQCGVYYHSRSCQKADWSRHKHECVAKKQNVQKL